MNWSLPSAVPLPPMPAAPLSGRLFAAGASIQPQTPGNRLGFRQAEPGRSGLPCAVHTPGAQRQPTSVGPSPVPVGKVELEILFGLLHRLTDRTSVV